MIQSAVKLLSVVGAMALTALATWFGTSQFSQGKVSELEESGRTYQSRLLGYTKYIDYVIPGKQAISEQAKFIAASVKREYRLVEHLEESRLKLKSQATIIVDYSVVYSFGFDLKPGSFELNAVGDGIEIKVGAPTLVAPPAVTPLRHEIPEHGLLTQEKDAVIRIQQKLPADAQSHGEALANDAAVRALCEKQLINFVRDFMRKQPGVTHVPAVTVAYKATQP